MIYCCGPDGSGKSTFLKEIETELQKMGVSYKSMWIRSPKIFSKPLMAYCHLVGLTKYRYIDGLKFGEHRFEKSTAVSALFPILQLIDFKLKWFLMTFSLPDLDYILMDRFAVDTLVDLMVSTKRPGLAKTWIGYCFMRMIPANALVFILDASEENIKKRKADTVHDPGLAAKIKHYRDLSGYLNCVPINNNGVRKDVTKEIKTQIQLYLGVCSDGK